MAKPLFVGYLKWVTGILLEDDVTNHLSLSTNKSISILTNLGHANLILSTLYKNCSRCNLSCLHEKVAEDQLFVKCSVKFICAMLKLSGMSLHVVLRVNILICHWLVDSTLFLMIVQSFYHGFIKSGCQVFETTYKPHAV